MSQVLNVSSLTEAENIVEEWIREFQLGQQLNNRLSLANKIVLERSSEKEYEYLTLGAEEGSDIDAGVEMITQGTSQCRENLLCNVCKL